MDGNVREPDVLHGMARQAGDAAACLSGAIHRDVLQMHAANSPDLRHGHIFSVASGAVAQADKDGRLGALGHNVAHVHVLQSAAVGNLK